MPTELSKPAAAVRARFASILYDDVAGIPVVEAQQPAYFPDLNLDQMVGAVTAGREEYDLAPYFYTRLMTPDAVSYRQEVLRDLEDPAVAATVDRFAQRQRTMRAHLARSQRFHYDVQRQAAFLAAAGTYLHAVRDLTKALSTAPVSSRGLTRLAGHLRNYVASGGFLALHRDAAETERLLAGVTYRLHVYGGRVDVRRYDEKEDDYAADVSRTFERFRQGEARSHLSRLRSFEEMNHVEAAIADLVARLFPEPFAALEGFHRRHTDFVDPTVAVFDREAQFYLAYLDFVERLRSRGLRLCYPDLSGSARRTQVVEAFDLALADKLAKDDRPMVCNDFSLRGSERILVVTGPNQGGKTTFARMVAQMHHVAALGLLVPGRKATLSLPDGIFTHFERGENLHDLTGKLEDDLVRIRDILQSATERSVIVLNEIFSSTSLADAAELAGRVLARVDDLGCLCVCVTFLDELAQLRDDIVSMVSTVSPHDPASRTFRLERRPADGLAYAEVLARKYGLTRCSVRRRVASS